MEAYIFFLAIHVRVGKNVFVFVFVIVFVFFTVFVCLIVFVFVFVFLVLCAQVFASSPHVSGSEGKPPMPDRLDIVNSHPQSQSPQSLCPLLLLKPPL